MSASFQVQAGSRLYTAVADCTTSCSALITGAVVDVILGGFFSPGFTLQTARKDLTTRSTQSGLFAVIGYPAQSFPQLASMSYQLALTLSAPGFQQVQMQVSDPNRRNIPNHAGNGADATVAGTDARPGGERKHGLRYQWGAGAQRR